MLGIIFARTLSLMRRYLAALLFLAAPLIAVAGIFQPGADIAVPEASGFALQSPKATRFSKHLRPHFDV